MFIHIGDGNVILSKKIITMMDYQTISTSINMEKMMQGWEANKQVVGPRKNAKSIIITTDKVYYTTVSVATLKRRASMLSTIRNMEDYSDEVMNDKENI